MSTQQRMIKSQDKSTMSKVDRPRLLIEEWLPAAAIGVESMRERGSASALAPHTYLHIWWARKPLVTSRAAVLASLLPADFPRDVFERLMGFWGTSNDILKAQQVLDALKGASHRINNPHGIRAFKNGLRPNDVKSALASIAHLWGGNAVIIDPMAGGGSIPLESARMGITTLANEYNPVACSILEATVDYPFRCDELIIGAIRQWASELRNRFNAVMNRFYPKTELLPPHCYMFARTVPCPDTQYPTPLVPDWYLMSPDGGKGVIAEPVVDKKKGTWTVQIRELGRSGGKGKTGFTPTYSDGKGVSLFTGRQIPADYIKAMAQAGRMDSALYAVAVKTNKGIKFKPPTAEDIVALKRAEEALKLRRIAWEKNNIIPVEKFPKVTSDPRPIVYGMPKWADMFSPRQLLSMGVLTEELNKVRPEIEKKEGAEKAAIITHILAIILDKYLNHNCNQARWENTHAVIKGKMDRHDYAFKVTYAEMAPCNSGSGLEWATENVLEAFRDLITLPRVESAKPVKISFGSATNMPYIDDKSITAVVVDPPYADNVQYSELADFFYVWLKRTQGYRHPEWFSTYLCQYDQEAIVNVSRYRDSGRKTAAEARKEAHAFYQKLMTDTFCECRRILRDDGVLTVMFTHKKQEAWESLFSSLIRAGFTITATWPVKTESEHSLHQARKNAAQSTVILVARKRYPGAGIGYFDESMKQEIRTRARNAAERMEQEGLNRVDQLVGCFGPAIEAYSQYDEVRTDVGEPIGVDRAISEASDAVTKWRVEKLASRGLEGVEAEGQFVLLCWDVLGAAEFRFNEAKLLGHAVGMDVDQLIVAGLVEKSGENIRMLSVKDRRREKALEPDEVVETLFGTVTVSKKKSKREILKIHPNDPRFRTTIDGCHALALRYLEAGGGAAGIGSAKALARQQQWNRDSSIARLMEALVHAAPEALQHEKEKGSVASKFPEFRAWHELLTPLFGLESPDWTEKKPVQRSLFPEFDDETQDPSANHDSEEQEKAD